MVLDHWDALEADFQHFYTIDLADAVWGRQPISARRFRVLTAGLPPQSRLVSEVAYSSAAWGNSEELLATLAELVDLNNRILLKANSKEGAEMPGPIIIRRPGQTSDAAASDEPVTMSPPEDVAAFFGMTYVPQETG